MNEMTSSAINRAHRQLRDAEAERRSSRGRSWNARAWSQYLNTITKLEAARADDFRRQITQARAAGPADHIFDLLERYNDQVAADANKYQARKKELYDLLDQWRSLQPRAISANEQLARDYTQIAYRLRARRVMLAQIEIERLEEQRRQKRKLSGNWKASWQALCNAFDAQDAAYRRVDSRSSLFALHNNRRIWCKEIRNMQRVTESKMSRFWRATERKELFEDIALVDAQIAKLQPQPSRAQSITGLVGVGMLVGVILVALLIFRGMRSNNAIAPSLASQMTPGVVSPISGAALPESDITTSADTPPDAQKLDDQGIELMQQAHCDEAIPLFQQAAAANSVWHKPLNDMAFCLYEQGKLVQAIEQWRKALALFADSQDSHAGLGMALYQLGQQSQGLAEYQHALALDGGYYDEGWMSREQHWSNKAITDSRPLRQQLGR